MYLEDIVAETPGASLVNSNTVSYYGLARTFEGRSVNGKWAVNEQDFLNFKEASYCSYLAASYFGSDINEIDEQYHCTEIHAMEDLVWTWRAIVNDQALSDARTMLIGLSVSMVSGIINPENAAKDIVRDMLKNLAGEILKTAGEEDFAEVLGAPTNIYDGGVWTINKILEYVNGKLDTLELKQLARALAKCRLAESLDANGLLGTSSSVIRFREKLAEYRGDVVALTQYGGLNASEFQRFKDYLLGYYDYVINMNNQDNWQSMHDNLHAMYNYIDSLLPLL